MATVHRRQPDAVIFAPPTAGATIRWIGNERGYAGETQWATYQRDLGENTAWLQTGIEGAVEWIPAEVDVSIRPGWYWHPDTDRKVKSPEKLVEIYEQSVGRNTNLLLNFPVDQRGLVHENDAEALRSMTAILRQTYTHDLARGRPVQATANRGRDPRFAPTRVVDGDDDSYWATDDDVTSASLTIDFGERTLFNRVLLREHIELGQRIRAWNLEAWDGTDWIPICSGTTVGHRRIAVFDAVTSTRLRVNVTESLAAPTLETVGVFVTPPVVDIQPDARAFLGSTTVTLQADLPQCTIHYTLDGSRPTSDSPRYAAPFTVTETMTIRAVASREELVSPRISRLDVTGYSNASLRPALSLTEPPLSGVQVERYEGGWQTLDQLTTRQPVDTKIATGVSIESRTRDEHVALVFTALIHVPHDGLYEFFGTSDDGSRIYLGNVRVVDNDGLHGPVERSRVIGLRQGYHPLRIEWFNATGGKSLRVEWTGPRLSRRPIEPSVLFRRPE